jgi:putative ABC transport system permease protein
VLRLVVFQGIVHAMAGIAVGLAGALALSRLMAGLLYSTRATDPMSFAAAVLVLCAVAVTASYVPARRATRVDPMVALRYQ